MEQKELIADISSALYETKRPGIEKLVFHMLNNGFFEAPCSGSYHLAEEGGLAQHSMNVYDTAYALNIALGYPCEEEEITIAALLHDLGKMGQFGKPNYTENLLKSGERSKSKPYETNKDLMPEEHEIRSVIIASKFIDLTEEEQHAILHHNGCWGKLDSSFSSSYDKYPLDMIIHFADLWSSRVTEVN